MKRLLALPLVVFGLLAAGGIALADHGDVGKPACADITNTDFGYTSANVATANTTTVEPSCHGITYTLNVIVDPGDPNSPIVTVKGRGGDDGDPTTPPTLLRLSTQTITDSDENPSVVEAYVTTSRGGRDGMNQLLDRNPDTGSIPLTAGGSGGSSGHN